MSGIRTETGRDVRLSILDFISDFRSEHGYAPTQLEIMDGLNLAMGTFRWHLASLVEQGYLTYKRHDFARTVKVSRRDRARLE